MRRFVLTNVVCAGITHTYDAVCRPETYQATIPQHYPSVRVMSVRGDTSVAEEHVSLGGRELVIMAKHVASPPHRHETFVIGGDAKGSHIVHELADGRGNNGGGGYSDGVSHPTGHAANAAANAATVITTTVSLKTGRLSILSGIRTGGRSDRESFVRIMNDLVRVAEAGAQGRC